MLCVSFWFGSICKYNISVDEDRSSRNRLNKICYRKNQTKTTKTFRTLDTKFSKVSWWFQWVTYALNGWSLIWNAVIKYKATPDQQQAMPSNRINELRNYFLNCLYHKERNQKNSAYIRFNNFINFTGVFTNRKV